MRRFSMIETWGKEPSRAYKRWSALVCVLLGGVLPGVSQQLPALQPAGSTTPPISSAPPLAVPQTAGAVVTYVDSALTVRAHNSSLNQILREIAYRTGMKITGRVPEDRVFGTYGPAAPAAVLADLLEGTGSNMLIVQDASHVPTELVLTRRTGGVSPPNPNAVGLNDGDDAEPGTPEPVRAAFPSPAAPAGNSRSPYRPGTGGADTNPAATSPSTTSQQVVFPPVDSSTPPSTATATPANGDSGTDTVKTPQQIFEQLQKLRQQQQTAKPQ